MKKLTSERLGRESLAAWEDRKSASELESSAKETDDDEEKVLNVKDEVIAFAERSRNDEEAQIPRGLKPKHFLNKQNTDVLNRF